MVKVIIATAVAQTSWTIKNLVVVIDTGLANEKIYLTKSDTTALKELPINEDTRIQRKGRVGRTREGRVYVLMMENKGNRDDFTPEIKKVD